MSQSGYGGGGEVSGLIGTLSLNPFLWGIEGPPRIFQNLVLVEESVKIWVFDCPEPSLDILKESAQLDIVKDPLPPRPLSFTKGFRSNTKKKLDH